MCMARVSTKGTPSYCAHKILMKHNQSNYYVAEDQFCLHVYNVPQAMIPYTQHQKTFLDFISEQSNVCQNNIESESPQD